MGLSSATEALVNFLTSKQLLPGSWANAISNQLYSIQTATASTTQTQAGGTAITSAAVAVTTANADDAVRLPKGYAGLEVFIANKSAAALGVFPAVGDIIWGSIGNAANLVLAQTASKHAIYKVGTVTAAGVATWYKVESN